MWKALIKLVDKWGCLHTFKLDYQTYVRTDFGGGYIKRIYICQKCGKFKHVKSNPA